MKRLELVALKGYRLVVVPVLYQYTRFLYVRYAKRLARQGCDKGCVRWEFFDVFEKVVLRRAEAHGSGYERAG